MRINVKKITNLPVYTKSNIFLGKVFDILIDVELSQIISYYAGKNFLSRLQSKADHIIGISEIISIDDKKMVVQDEVVKNNIFKEKKVIIEDGEASVMNSEIE